MKSIYAVYVGTEDLVLSRDFGEPAFVVDGTLDDAKLAASEHWEAMEIEMFESDTKVDLDWDTCDDTTYACSPLGYWMAIKPVSIVDVTQGW